MKEEEMVSIAHEGKQRTSLRYERHAWFVNRYGTYLVGVSFKYLLISRLV